MGINYAPLVADLFLFCYERDFVIFHDKRDDFDFETVNFPFLDGFQFNSIQRFIYLSPYVQT